MHSTEGWSLLFEFPPPRASSHPRTPTTSLSYPRFSRATIHRRYHRVERYLTITGNGIVSPRRRYLFAATFSRAQRERGVWARDEEEEKEEEVKEEELMRRETVRKSMRDVRGTVVVFSIRRRRVSGTQLPRPAPRPYRKVSWLSLFFHAINERLERPLSMALWRLAFIPSSSGILPALFSSRIPPASFHYGQPADVAAHIGTGSMVLPLSLFLILLCPCFSSLFMFFATFFCLDCTSFLIVYRATHTIRVTTRSRPGRCENV